MDDHAQNYNPTFKSVFKGSKRPHRKWDVIGHPVESGTKPRRPGKASVWPGPKPGADISSLPNRSPGVHALKTFRAVKQRLEHLPLTCKHWVFLVCILRQKKNKFYYKLLNQKLEVERAICG